MKTNSYTDAILSVETSGLIDQFLASPETNFVAQVRMLNLDPKNDFKFVDLSGVDFSNCDLRGFDFTGADLSRSVGIDTVWNSRDTIFQNAETSGSMFHYALSQERYFQRNPGDLEIVNRWAKGYWLNTILDVEQFLRAGAGSENSIRVARAVFDATKDASVRSNILLFMGASAGSPEDHKAFIYNALNRFSGDVSVTTMAMRTLSAFYLHHDDAFQWLLKFVGHPNQFIGTAAFEGAVRSKHFASGWSVISPYAVSSSIASHRRAYVGRAAEMLDKQTQRAAYNWRTKQYFDFDKSIAESDQRVWNDREYSIFRAENSDLNPGIAIRAFLLLRLYRLAKLGEKIGVSFEVDYAVGIRTLTAKVSEFYEMEAKGIGPRITDRIAAYSKYSEFETSEP